jgi:hypothetical protein
VQLLEWESFEGDSSDPFSILWTHGYFDLCRRRVDPEGYPQGNVKSGLPGWHPREIIVVERQGRRRPPRREVGLVPARDPCVTKSERQVV